MSIVYLSEEGAIRLAEIVRAARKTVSYRTLRDEVGLSHTTLMKLEKGKPQGVEAGTLKKIAQLPQVPYSFEQLRKICMSGVSDSIPTPVVAADLYSTIATLPSEEVIQLAEFLLKHPRLSLKQRAELIKEVAASLVERL